MSKSLGSLAFFGGVIGLAVANSGNREPDIQTQVVARPGTWAETRIPRSRDGHFYVHAMVDGQLVRFLVDTGATQIALTLEDAERVGAQITPAAFEVVGTGASGPVRGQRIRLRSVSVDGKEITSLPAIAVEGLDRSLLGQAYLSRMSGVSMTSEQMIIR
jgi:aspartyl protease family protein